MPSQYDLPEFTGWYDQQDVNLYNKLPFYLATMQARRQGLWQVYDKMYGKIPWQPNMGTTMKAVEAVYSPIGRSTFFPNPITALPNKDVFQTQERTEQCNILMHDFFSQNMYFLPSFQDFRTGQVDFQNDDIVRQIGVGNDVFVRTVTFQKSPYVYCVGNTSANDANVAGFGNIEILTAPYVPGGTDLTQANVDLMGKSANYLKAIAALCATSATPGIRLRTIKRMVMTMRDQLGAPFFEGTQNTPSDNQVIKGKYVMTGDQSIFDNFVFDPDLNSLRDITSSTVEDGFQASPFNQLTFKAERFPLHMDDNGTFPVPELVTATGDVVPNPAYTNTRFSWAFLHGADAYKSIKIGPPPKPFAGGDMDPKTFQGMSWNGEVRLSRNIMLKDANGIYDNNSMGRFVRLQAALTMGCLPNRPRNCIPILYQRQMPANQAA
jgi:hypothetical protein